MKTEQTQTLKWSIDHVVMLSDIRSYVEWADHWNMPDDTQLNINPWEEQQDSWEKEQQDSVLVITATMSLQETTKKSPWCGYSPDSK